MRGSVGLTDQVAAVGWAQRPGVLELAELEEGARYWPATLIAYLLGEIETTGLGI